jgi:hypothetical protein
MTVTSTMQIVMTNGNMIHYSLDDEAEGMTPTEVCDLFYKEADFTNMQTLKIKGDILFVRNIASISFV